MKKAGYHFVATTRKVTQHRDMNISETVSEYEVQDIISSSGDCQVLPPSPARVSRMRFKSCEGAVLADQHILGALKYPSAIFASPVKNTLWRYR